MASVNTTSPLAKYKLVRKRIEWYWTRGMDKLLHLTELEFAGDAHTGLPW